ncbi:Anthocyanidin 3-O-glucoside 2'''-O-xylosyltransferase [Linum perenne]
MAAADDSKKQLTVAMFPLFAMGHITPFLHLSNGLAARGHRISFLVPTRTIPKVAHLSNHPALITFHPITVPHVAGLPVGSELIADVPPHLTGHIFAALDATEDQFRSILRHVRPDFVIYDATPWIPRAAREVGCVSVSYGTSSAVSAALRLVPSARIVKGVTDEELGKVPPGYPSSAVGPRADEISKARVYAMEFGSMSLYERIVSVIEGGDVMAMRSCWELEGKYVEYFGKQYGKRVLLTGPVLPKSDGLGLDEKLGSWLSRFSPNSVVYCAFGSEVVLHKDQFQELLRGIGAMWATIPDGAKAATRLQDSRRSITRQLQRQSDHNPGQSNGARGMGPTAANSGPSIGRMLRESLRVRINVGGTAE